MPIGASSDKKGSPNGDYTDKELVMGKVTSSPNGEKVKKYSFKTSCFDI